VLIISHGMCIRAFVMRFMHLKVEEFDSILNPKNGDVITISDRLDDAQNVVFRTEKWGVTGLELHH
jgi:broad specificity phosphatase PhoE